MYLVNKYTNTYYNIINNAKARNFLTKTEAKLTLGYVEVHHVIPRSLSGSNKKDNLVFLTAREHFICHWLLIKMTTGYHQEKMIYALNGMRRNSKNHSRYETKITSRVYDLYKQKTAKLLSAINRGKTWNHSDEAKEKISKANTGITRDDEFRLKVSQVHKGKIESVETRIKKSVARTGKKHDAETIQKLSDHSGRAIPVTIDDVTYKSKKYASLALFPDLPIYKGIRRINKLVR